MAKKYTLRNDEIYYRDTDGELKLCLAQSEVPAVLTEFHESSFGGHWGRDYIKSPSSFLLAHDA